MNYHFLYLSNLKDSGAGLKRPYQISYGVLIGDEVFR